VGMVLNAECTIATGVFWVEDTQGLAFADA